MNQCGDVGPLCWEACMSEASRRTRRIRHTWSLLQARSLGRISAVSNKINWLPGGTDLLRQGRSEVDPFGNELHSSILTRRSLPCAPKALGARTHGSGSPGAAR